MSTHRIETPHARSSPQASAALTHGDDLKEQMVTVLEGNLLEDRMFQDAAQMIEKTLEQHDTSPEIFDSNIKALKEAVEKSTDLGHGNGSMQSLILTAIHCIQQKRQGEAALRPLLRHNEHFKHLKEDQLWRFFIGSRFEGSNNPYEFDNQPGYYGAMCKGLAHVLSHSQEPMTVNMYESLQRICVDQVGQTNTGVIKETRESFPILKKIPQGYRSGIYSIRHPPPVVELHFESQFPETPNATFPGLYELRDHFAGDDWCRINFPDSRLGEPSPTPYVQYKGAQMHECQRRVAKSLSRYYHDLQYNDAEGSELKRTVECCRALAVTHPFADGNIRVANLVMNKMLMDTGLPPTILQDPNILFGYDHDTLVTEVKEGQKHFQTLCRQPAQPPPENGRQI